jgi:hypothetical protein
VNSLDLRVTDGASGAVSDHADWAGARLINGLPAASNNLSAMVAGGSRINLTWTDNSYKEMPLRFFATPDCFCPFG